MKRPMIKGWVLLGLLLATRAIAGLPLPSITFCGLFLDSFGWPYTEGYSVEVSANGGRVVSKALLSSTGRDYNFLVRVPYDSGGIVDDYAPGVVTFGDDVQVRLIEGRTGSEVMRTNFVCRIPPGSVIRFTMAVGTDTVGDGLPDDLRRWIWAARGGFDTFVAANIRATDDSDEDGVSNLGEYLAGTDPSNPDDVLAVEIASLAGTDVTQLSFFTVPGKTYRIESGRMQASGVDWTTTLFSRTPAAAPDVGKVVGTGHRLSAFVTAEEVSRLYRVVVLPQVRGSVVLP